MANLRKLLILIFIFFINLNFAYAFNLGLLVKNPSVNASINQTIKFIILFWNTGNETYNVTLNMEKAPKEWFIYITPKTFTLKPFSGKEYVYLPYTKTKALPVEIFVKPMDVKKSNYTVLVSAKAYLENEGISVVQERKISLKINFLDIEKPQTPLIEKNESIKKLENDMISNYNYYLFIFGLILIFVFSVLIYKYA